MIPSKNARRFLWNVIIVHVQTTLPSIRLLPSKSTSVERLWRIICVLWLVFIHDLTQEVVEFISSLLCLTLLGALMTTFGTSMERLVIDLSLGRGMGAESNTAKPYLLLRLVLGGVTSTTDLEERITILRGAKAHWRLGIGYTSAAPIRRKSHLWTWTNHRFAETQVVV